MIDTSEIIEDILLSTTSAFSSGYDTEKILLTQELYDTFKNENEQVLGIGEGDFYNLLGYSIEINNDIDSYMVVVKEI